jgi:haloalkane dehalogenase
VEQDGLRLHYLDEGSGPPVLLLHGEPTWSYLYRKIIPELTPAARAIAPDYFGFGRSDKPLRVEDYSYDFHTATIARLVEELDLRDATVVVQDWGGPVGLRVAVEHPDRIARLVIMNTGIGGGRPPSEEWLRFRDWVRRLGTELVPGRLVRISAVQPLSDEVEEAYSAPWPVPESKAGIVAFPELVPTSPDHPDVAAHLAVREQLSRWEQPALVLFSDSDPIFSPRHAERIAAHIPGALEPEIVAGAGHFLQEDKGEEIGRRIARFVREGV